MIFENFEKLTKFGAGGLPGGRKFKVFWSVRVLTGAVGDDLHFRTLKANVRSSAVESSFKFLTFFIHGRFCKRIEH